MRRLLVSFSGGETSAFMAQWLWNNKRDEYEEMVFVFANTGEENEETLRFVENCSNHFRFNVVWVEAKVHHGIRRGTSFTIVDYLSASREGQPFEQVIKKYGIPNKSFPHCTRELKQNPIHAYIKSLGWKDYYTAIGIRADEFDRMNPNRKALKLVYPLIEMIPTTKPAVNRFWNTQPFRLPLKGYQGNCKVCWKKSDPKLYQIAKENECAFSFFGKMEMRYGKYTPETRLRLLEHRGEMPKQNTFFRKGRSVEDIIRESKGWRGRVIDDSMYMDESCDIFSSCGD